LLLWFIGFVLCPQDERTFSTYPNPQISFSSRFHCIGREMFGELKGLETVGNVQGEIALLLNSGSHVYDFSF